MGKIGLVLVGGAIKGAYEVGVLKAMAQAGVQPDVIVGISAGAINGAFAAQAIARGEFTPERIEQDLCSIWRDRVTADNFYHAEDTRRPGSGERPPLSQLFHRLGIDPLARRYRPRWSVDALKAFEQLVRGEFTSIMSHGFLRRAAEDHLVPPRQVVKPVTLSVVTTNLMGSTEMTDHGVVTRYSHYEEFDWREGKGDGEWEAMLRRLRLMISASSAFPGVFPPVPLGLPGDVGYFCDGGLMDCAPIGRAIALDPEIDTVYVSLGSTIVGRPEARPDNLLKITTRVFSILAGKFVIQNYQKVQRVNQRIAALRQVLVQDEDGRVLPTPANEHLCVAAGFNGLADFLSRREVRLVPIFPRPSLPGDIFDAFFDPALRHAYLERGYEDGLRAFSREAIVEGELAATEEAFQREVAELFSEPGRVGRPGGRPS